MLTRKSTYRINDDVMEKLRAVDKVRVRNAVEGHEKAMSNI